MIKITIIAFVALLYSSIYIALMTMAFRSVCEYYKAPKWVAFVTALFFPVVIPFAILYYAIKAIIETFKEEIHE